MWTLGGAPSEKRPVEPLEVLAHQAAGEEMMRLDRLTRRVDHAAIAYPAVASLDGPVIQSNPVVRLVGLGLERVQRELPARVVEKQVVGLGYVVDARAGSSRLNHVNGDVDPGRSSWRAVVTTRSRAQTPHGPSPTMAMRSKAA